MKIFPNCKIEEKLVSLIDEDRNSDKKKKAKKCEEYYEGRHDILNYKIFYFNSDGNLIEDTTRSNIKISHPFYTELIDQKTSYLLSKFSITSKEKELNEELEYYFDDEFKDELADTCEDSSKVGFGYMFAQVDENMKIRFKNAYALGVREVYSEDDDTLEYVVYYYVDRIDKDKKIITRVEVHDKEQTYYYVLMGNKLEKDPKKKINPMPHKTWQEIIKGKIHLYGEGLGFIPFFRLDNNRKQYSDLKPIKALIDDYDLMNCGLSNNLQDIAEGIYVVKGFQGDDLSELQTNIKQKKVVGVGDNGDVDIKTIEIPYEARKIKLDIDEKNIYRFGMGFNSSQVGDGNITNIVIKSRYVLLDLKCDKAERKLRKFLKNIVQIVLDEINQNKDTAYNLKDVDICLDRETLTNEVDNATIAKTEAETKQLLVNTLLNAASDLPDETVIKGICDYLEIDYEEIKKDIENKLNSEKLDLNQVSEDLMNGNVDE